MRIHQEIHSCLTLLPWPRNGLVQLPVLHPLQTLLPTLSQGLDPASEKELQAWHTIGGNLWRVMVMVGNLWLVTYGWEPMMIEYVIVGVNGFVLVYGLCWSPMLCFRWLIPHNELLTTLETDQKSTVSGWVVETIRQSRAWSPAEVSTRPCPADSSTLSLFFLRGGASKNNLRNGSNRQ